MKYLILLTAVIFLSGCSSTSQVMKTDKNIAESANQLEESFSDSIRIGVITDIHKCDFRSPGKITTERIQAFVDDVDTRNTDLNIDLGDNIRYRLEGCDNDAPEELAWVIGSLKTKAPLYHVLSDHDVDDHRSFEYWKEITNTPKTYYSFDVKNFHIIVLDTVSGDGDLDLLCRAGSQCEKVKEAYQMRRDLLKNLEKLALHLAENQTTKEKVVSERDYYENQFKAIRNQGAQLVEIEKRDKGSILEPQLSWLKSDLEKTDKKKIIIFSDHPLIAYEGKRKNYEIVNREQVSQILENSGKQIVSINGETHEWNEANINGVQYYLIGKFSDSDIGSWAVLEWNEESIRLEKIEK
ncbi:MAG: metallophosphoesterase [Candidatus Moranbacteria bacterium]|nr:metallophosphoesterase [Candidatus Moranbacteria bacterium]